MINDGPKNNLYLTINITTVYSDQQRQRIVHEMAVHIHLLIKRVQEHVYYESTANVIPHVSCTGIRNGYISLETIDVM